jgi:hypothetical protein
MVVPVSPPEGVQLDDIPPDFSLHQDLHTTTGDTTLYKPGSSTSPNTTGAADNDSDTGNQVIGPKAFINTPLQLGQTLIVYHPHSQQSPEIINTTELMFPREPQPSLLPAEPWAPFTSRDDFEQAELFLKHDCTNRHINDQLRLNQKRDSHNYGPGDSPSMKNAHEMHRIINEASSDFDISSVG